MRRCWRGWRSLSAQYPRYGYRRIAIFLGRDGHAMSFGRAHRLWRQARLQVPRKRPRKRVATGRPRPNAPTGANQVWSYDFVFDWCANGQQLKCLTVTDEWTKEGLAIEVDGRIRSGRVIEVLSRLVSERGAPLYLRSDNGPEFVSRALAEVDRRPGHRHRIDRSGQTLAEWRDGELQRQVPRRVPEPRMVPVTDRGEGADRSVAASTSTRCGRIRASAISRRPRSRPSSRSKTQRTPEATGRIAAVCGASAPRPVAQPSRKGQTKAAIGVVVSS